MTERIDNFGENPFLSGPAEFLCKAIAAEIRKVEEFGLIFGDSIDEYMRMDYSIRQLPALRIYNFNLKKDFDSWFITGQIHADVIFPGSIRRNDTQRLQDTISSALLQQFRRITFFNNVRAACPALNELGKEFESDKSLGFEMAENYVPLTKITLNYRIDLREWDLYMEQTGRTKDDPFHVTLGDLKHIIATIEAMRDDGSVELTVGIDQDV